MGTTVLSPQDCLTPSHGHHHQFTDMLPAPASRPRSRSGRIALHASLVQCMFPSPASDCARRNWSGAVIRADEGLQNGVPGLLPVPGTRLPRQSSPRRSSSRSSSIPRHSASAASSPSRQASPLPRSPFPTGSNAKLKASQSASSALLPRGTRASSVGTLERLHSSSGRLPFKVVQSNGLVNGAVLEGQNATIPVKHGDMQTSKYLDAHSDVGKKRGGSEHRCESRKPTPRDLSFRQGEKGLIISSRSGLSNVAIATKERRKDVEGKKVGNRRQEERRNACEKDAGETPAVTILQRPKDKGEADELIAKFFKMVDGSSSVSEVSRLENQNKEGRSEDSACFTKEDRGSDDLSDSAFHQDLVAPKMQNLADRIIVAMTKKDEGSHAVELLRQQSDVQMQESSPGQCVSETKETQSAMEVDADSGDFSGHIDSMLGIDGWLPMVGNERWAGPAYTNSPPPSSLPLPKFSVKQSRTSSLELSPIKYQYVECISDPSSVGTSSMPVLLPHIPGSLWSSLAVHDQGHEWDAAFATKDLRRILNLDCC